MIRLLLSERHIEFREYLKSLLTKDSEMKIISESYSYDGIIEKLYLYSFDVVLLDLDMFGRRGMEVIQHVRKSKYACKIICLSNQPEDKHAFRYLHAGASAYIAKSNVDHELITAIKTTFNTGTYLSPMLVDELAKDLIDRTFATLNKALSSREIEIFQLLAKGMHMKEISELLNIHYSTVNTFRIRIFKKLNLNNEEELIEYANRQNQASLEIK